MELKEYLKILKKYSKTLIFVIFLVTAFGLIYFLFKPISYSTSVTINITRNGQRITEDYQYGNFYRLQADEKFAETLVEWLKSPRSVANIYENSGFNLQNISLKKLSKAFRAEKLSSQVVSVSYGTNDEKTAKKIANSIEKILSENTSSLNQYQKEESWFKIIAHKPLIIRDNPNLIFVFCSFLLIGIFIAFWLVLIIHYLK